MVKNAGKDKEKEMERLTILEKNGKDWVRNENLGFVDVKTGI
jgi:hypothetical protein